MDVARHRLAEANSHIVALLVPNGRSDENSAADAFAYSMEKQLEHALQRTSQSGDHGYKAGQELWRDNVPGHEGGMEM
ncbi:hypothetical protein CIP107509_02344 [Corynebacterium diphtheriae]|nr:hypothetical protein FRC061569_02017 [Corynebacterium diphtheriae]CAB0528352.1 hypothetical protein FRC020322_02257 [Corynebacterium diphtheriae]CAB0528585.1 hypothetical protein FRC020338_02251 [Corynebacterium diphtheriae]CAB0529005.1 hypothetical protein FRC031641_02256 [Corynebacterium diphtheriae]CAB0570799.1 hypothetical protein CIP107522_02129 [Corynebacterium diphtheriae]